MGTNRICIHNKTHIRTVLNSYTAHITYRIPYYIILSAIYIQFFFLLDVQDDIIPRSNLKFKFEIYHLEFPFETYLRFSFLFTIYIEMLPCHR